MRQLSCTGSRESINLHEELIVNLSQKYNETAPDADVIEEDKNDDDKWSIMDGQVIQTEYC